MSKVVMTEYDGIKYSLRPHGFRSRLLILLAIFVVSFGGTLLASVPAQAAASLTQIDSCLSGWYWKSGTGEKEIPPSVTSSGMVFNDQDTVNAVLAWYIVDLPPSSLDSVAGDKWSMAVLSGAVPGANSAFKLTTSPWTGTWNYSGGGSWWSSGGGSVVKGDYTTAQAKTALAGAQVVAFGLGTETISMDGPWTVSQLTFAGSVYSLACVPPAPSPSPSPVAVEVPGPTVTVTMNVTAPAVAAVPTTSAAQSPTPSLSVSSSKSPAASATHLPTISVKPASNEGNPLLPWGIGVAALTGAAVAAAGVRGIVRRRKYQGSHFVAAGVAGNDEMATGHDEYESQMISKYGAGEYDPSLGGHSGGSYEEPALDETRIDGSPVSDVPPDNTETKQIPPVV